MAAPWLILADDLTGAADCGIAFAKVGLSTVVGWNESGTFDDVAVLALDTDSRHRSVAEAVERQTRTLGTAHRSNSLVYKKIDSTLRGHPAEELTATLEVLGNLRGGQRPLALVAPAFPATGRTTEGGRILVAGQRLETLPLWARDHSYTNAVLPQVIASAGLETGTLPLSRLRAGEEAVRSTLIEARRHRLGALVCDAVSEQDLATLAVASLPFGCEVMWVGSGGLAVHLARLVTPRSPVPPSESPPRAPVLIVIGSLADLSRRQAAHVVEHGQVSCLEVTSGELLAAKSPRWREIQSELTHRLGKGEDVLVDIALEAHPDLTRGAELAARFAHLLRPVVSSAGTLVASGGDTLRALLDGLGVQGIRPIDEIEPGVPFGAGLGPMALPIISKAGSFGDERTLQRCLEWVHRRAPGSKDATEP